MWNTSGEVALQQRLSHMQVVHAPALHTDAGGLSGGVATLIALGYSLLKHVVILQGRIHAVLFQTRIMTFWVINCYFHPLERSQSLTTLSEWIDSDKVGEHQVIVCGDFNQAEIANKALWDHLLQSADLHDLTAGIQTYHHIDVRSEHYKVLGPLELFSSNQLHFSVSK